MFIWENKKYPFDIMDADTMAVFGEAEQELWDSLSSYEEEHAKNGRIDAEGVKAECRIIDAFFENVFGEGKAEEMFCAKYNLAERTKAVKKLYNLRKSQMEEHNSRIKALSSLVSKGDA
ncbi:hypothetical protein C818_04229 [Lachnospiraceae bacterium MD308]|nr:hypothetical protein C818_04229 [Lachnospiraceae bacterium MD308]